MNKLLLVILAVISAFAAVPVSAATVELASEAHLVKTVDGKEVLEAPTGVVPGDRIAFTLRYRNTGAEPVDDFVITNPLPAPVMLAQDGDFEVSVDGGKTWGRLSALTVTEADATRPATTADATHVRWKLARIAPAATGEVSYFGVVK